MKRFITYTLAVAVFFVGLGSIVEQAGARFKSDAKALEIVNRARLAIGGDAAISQVRAMVITGRSTHTLKIGDNVRTEPGESEIAIQFPDKLSQRIKIGTGSGNAEAVALTQKDIVMVREGEAIKLEPGTADGFFTTREGQTIAVAKASASGEPGEHTFTTKDGKTVMVRTVSSTPGQAVVAPDGEAKTVIMSRSGAETKTFTTEDGKTVTVTGVAREGQPFEVSDDGAKEIRFARTHGHPRQNELLRLSLALLLTAPEGIDVSYSFVGESTLDGSPVNLVRATAGGQAYMLYFDTGSSLPVAMSYQDSAPRIMAFKANKAPDANAPSADVMVRATAEAAAPASTEKLVKFSDYRSTNGVQLPYKWTTEVDGAASDVFEVTQFEINPANIADRFTGGSTIRLDKIEKQ